MSLLRNWWTGARLHLLPAACLLILAASTAHAASTFHDRVAAIYSFSPHTLDKAGIAARSNDLDAFWRSVKSSGPAGLEDLRTELARSDASPFFSYDGAKLLLSLSNTAEDRTLALSAISRTNLRDVQREDYFFTIHQFAVDGFDTSEAAFKILDDPAFNVYVAQHALTLDQEMCLVYLLLPTKEEFYLDKAEKLLFSEKDVTAQESLLGLIADTVTKSGDEALARFAGSSDQPAKSREYARQIIGATRKMKSMPIVGISMSSYPSLKAEQRKLFARVSDEALDEWEHLRLKLRHRGYD